FSLEILIPASAAGVISTYTYSVIAFCSYKIWKQLKTQAGSMSRRTTSLNEQLNRMLLVQ
ncbi:hypothetical protein AAVH_37683, partial [Aphelenchoides avenae]